MDRAPQPGALGEIVDMSRVTLIAGDVLLPLSLVQAIRDHGITEIIHLAANPMFTVGAQSDPYPAIQLNIMGTMNVLEAARVQGVGRVVVATSNVLNHHIEGGEGKGDPSREEAYPRPITFYSACKQAVENLGLNYARWFGVDFVALRYGAVAGPWSGAGGGGPSKVFRSMIQAAFKGEEAVVPSTRLEWVYSKDAARGTVLALKIGAPERRVFNMTMGRLNGPDEISAALKSVFPGVRVRVDEPGDGTPALQENKYASDLSYAKAVLGFVPEYQMNDAVRDTAAWLKARAA
jgi:nucleoside-diphosphate-sugar epimerase